jgi:hypothetical protein
LTAEGRKPVHLVDQWFDPGLIDIIEISPKVLSR